MKNIVLIIGLVLSFNSAFSQVGVGTTEPKSTLDVNGSLSVKVVSLDGGPVNLKTIIDDGVYFNLTPTGPADSYFELPDPTGLPGRIYILRNITDSVTANISIEGSGQEFYAGDSTAGTTVVQMTTATGGGNETKTLMFVSDGANWTYGKFSF